MRRVMKLAAMMLVTAVVCGVALAAEATSTDTTVTVEGFSACPAKVDVASCRHAALADAFRRAVEKAVGVNVDSDTATQSFALVRDTVRTTSEGYIRSYRILEEGRSDDTYRVKIEAVVAPGTPEQSLARICRRLNEEAKVSFHVSVDGQPGKALSSQLAALGLKVITKKAGVEIGGRIGVMPSGERYGDFVVYASHAYTQISVEDTASGLVIPSVDVELPKSITGDSGEASKTTAVSKVCELWIQRNLPIIGQALLEPGKPMDIESSQPEPGISSAAVEVIPTANLIPSNGPRLPIGSDDLTALARKLADAVNARAEFGARPVDIAVSRFKGIGISDAASVEDVLEDLSTSLVKTGVFQLVERAQLDKVLLELKVQNSGLVDSATAKKLGKLVGARAVLVGSISDRPDCVVVNARLINTETGLVGIAESIVVRKETEPEPVILRAGPGRQK